MDGGGPKAFESSALETLDLRLEAGTKLNIEPINIPSIAISIWFNKIKDKVLWGLEVFFLKKVFEKIKSRKNGGISSIAS